MDFTSLYSHAGTTCTIASPNDALLATATLTLLVLRDAESFQVLQSWRIPSGCCFTQLAFAQDSHYLVAADISEKSPIVHVYSVTLEDKPAAVFTPGSEGLQGVKWWDTNAFGKRWLACWSRHNIRITVWDLETSKQYHIASPKRGCDGGWAISPLEPDYVAVLERHTGRDYIGIYDLDRLSLVRHFALETTDALGLAWSPCGNYIAVWESSLEYGLFLYSPAGRLLHHHDMPRSDGLLGLGIKQVVWHPSGRFLAIGGYDDVIRILADANGWRSVAEFDLPGGLFGTPQQLSGLSSRRVHTFTEANNTQSGGQSASGIAAFEEHTHNLLGSAVAVLTGSSDSSKRRPAAGGAARGTVAIGKDLGVEHLSFSPSGHFLVATSASPASNKTLLVLIRFLRSSPALPFTAIRPRLSSIVKLQTSIRRLAWRPSPTLEGKECLAIVTGQKNIHIWNEETPQDGQGDSSSDEDTGELGQDLARPPRPGLMETITVPSRNDFAAMGLRWSSNGSSLVLSGPTAFCLAWPLPVRE